MSGCISVAQRGNVLVATIINEPYGLMDRHIIAELALLAARADQDPGVSAVVLTGGHPTRFLAHFDVRLILGSAEASPSISASAAYTMMQGVAKAMKVPGMRALLQKGPLAGFAAMEGMHQVLRSIEHCSAIWIAALNGDTGGGGCELSLACDKRFMADGNFSIAQPEIFLGFPPGSGGTQRLTRLLGKSKALQICLDGGPMTPAQALELGLIDRVLPAEQLLEAAIAEAARLGQRPKNAIGAIKRAIHMGATLPLEDGLRLEAAEFLRAITTKESLDAQRAYVRCMTELGDLPIANDEIVKSVLTKGRFI